MLKLRSMRYELYFAHSVLTQGWIGAKIVTDIMKGLKRGFYLCPLQTQKFLFII